MVDRHFVDSALPRQSLHKLADTGQCSGGNEGAVPKFIHSTSPFGGFIPNVADAGEAANLSGGGHP